MSIPVEYGVIRENNNNIAVVKIDHNNKITCAKMPLIKLQALDAVYNFQKPSPDFPAALLREIAQPELISLDHYNAIKREATNGTESPS